MLKAGHTVQDHAVFRRALPVEEGYSHSHKEISCQRNKAPKKEAPKKQVAKETRCRGNKLPKKDPPELVEPVGQPDRLDQLPVLLDHQVALLQLRAWCHLM